MEPKKKVIMKRRNDITNDMVLNLYFNGFNRRQTAGLLKCSEDLIAYRLKQLNIKPKPMSECVFNGKKRNVLISQTFNNVLSGEMLGDGHLHRHYIQGYFAETFGYDKKEWAEYLVSLFLKNKIPIMGKGLQSRKPCGKSKNITWSFSTLNTVELGELQVKWYYKNKHFDENKQTCFSNRQNIKTIPVDLKLTPECLLHWYVGDGTTSGNGCSIMAQGFSREEIEFLRFRLKEDLNIKSSYYDSQIIRISKSERIKFLEIIGECPVECYKYKWKINKTSCIKNRKQNDQIDMKIVEKYINRKDLLMEV
jgi:hypothetical protein